jgi:hypothetical protein
MLLCLLYSWVCRPLRLRWTFVYLIRHVVSLFRDTQDGSDPVLMPDIDFVCRVAVFGVKGSSLTHDRDHLYFEDLALVIFIFGID